MPEESNRVLADRGSDIFFCPAKTAVNNLRNEGFSNISNDGRIIESIDFLFPNPSLLIFDPCSLPLIVNIGDVMYDSVLPNVQMAEKRSDIMKTFNLEPQTYAHG